MRQMLMVSALAVTILGIAASTSMAMYHPTLGRFVQRDPMGYVDGMSTYEYVGSRPLCVADAMGLMEWRTTGSPQGETGEAVGQNNEVLHTGIALYASEEEKKSLIAAGGGYVVVGRQTTYGEGEDAVVEKTCYISKLSVKNGQLVDDTRAYYNNLRTGGTHRFGEDLALDYTAICVSIAQAQGSSKSLEGAGDVEPGQAAIEVTVSASVYAGTVPQGLFKPAPSPPRDEADYDHKKGAHVGQSAPSAATRGREMIGERAAFSARITLTGKMESELATSPIGVGATRPPGVGGGPRDTAVPYFPKDQDARGRATRWRPL
jgi:hypothetical protein